MTVTAPVLLAALLLLGWAFTARLGRIPEYLLPSPGAVGARLLTDLTSGELWPYLGLTLTEALGGCLLGAAVAIPLAVAIHRLIWFRAAVQPFLGATQAIPAIALAPLLVLWVGYGLGPVILLCALMVFFPILVSTVLGLRHVDPDVLRAARVDGADAVRLLTEIEFPLAWPAVLAGLRNGFTLSVTGAVVGEMVMGGRGLGMVLTVQRDAVDTAGMFATIAVLCVVAATIYSLIYAWERNSRLTDVH
ncbi:MAG: ABC transporter permease [Propionibacteriaceae bacterium]|nr:ABC transporter permease [Propionibacteriaceae bacterium]